MGKVFIKLAFSLFFLAFSLFFLALRLFFSVLNAENAACSMVLCVFALFLHCGSLCVGCCSAWSSGTEDLACFPQPVAVFLCEMVIYFIYFYFFYSHLCCLLVCQGVQAPLHSCFALGVCRGLEVGTVEGEQECGVPCKCQVFSWAVP